MIELYHKNHTNKQYTSIGLFREIKNKINPKKVLYPGSYVHITPSLIFPDVTYVDSFKNTKKFYDSKEVKEYINENKEYSEESQFTFYQQDYFKDIPEDLESFDVVISQYAGFVGQAVKKYLKRGGVLVCNNSHGDASMASLDGDYELYAIYRRRSDDKFTISDKNLSDYLIPKKKDSLSKELLERTMRGVAYIKSPSGYIFRKKWPFFGIFMRLFPNRFRDHWA